MRDFTEALNARLFYAHLYLGLYYEAAGDVGQARKHLAIARQHKIGHYMWNVADVHAKLLETTAKDLRCHSVCTGAYRAVGALRPERPRCHHPARRSG